MQRATIDRISITEDGELLLRLEGKADPSYQYIYREAAGVYWDPEARGFKSTPMKDWTCSKWFAHIVQTAQSSLDLALQLSPSAEWQGVPVEEKHEILAASDT